MTVAKHIPYCPRCKRMGTVVDQYKKMLKMECPSCGYRWSTLSELCQDCKKPNGFAVKGPCGKCYSERYKIS